MEKLVQALQQYVRPETFPVAVKFSREGWLPEKVRRPRVAFGHRLNLCQGIAMARRMGWTVGLLPEDHACAPSLIVLGLAEKPDFVTRGELVYPLYAATPEIGARTEEHTPLLPPGTAKSVVIAPLERAGFEPDVIVVYGNAAQMARLIQGALYHRGGRITSHFTGRASCANELVLPYLTGECQVIVPGAGERVFALTEAHELCFALPAARAEELARGLADSHKQGGLRVPVPFMGLLARPKFPDYYRRLEETVGVTDP
ncbi:MAG: DUF169 domain-containing protein [Firmicutes bacterium]|nr:DUF169 domain-containing protein [Bacillota bacterium]